jgi:hypothetical protein
MPNFDPTNKLQAAELLRKLRNSTLEDINNNFNNIEEYAGFYNKVKKDAGLTDEEIEPKQHPMLKPDVASLLPEDDTSFGEIKEPERFPNLRKQYNR